jgi:ankyrin repeat protein
LAELEHLQGITPLTHAIINGRHEIAQCLLSGGANVNAVGSSGRSPLDLAVYQGSAEIIDILLENGANMEKLDIKGVRPLLSRFFLRRVQSLGQQPGSWLQESQKFSELEYV